MEITVAQILDFLKEEQVQFQFQGDPNLKLQGFSSLAHYKEGTFTWLKSKKNLSGIDGATTYSLLFLQDGVKLDLSLIHISR